LIIKNKIYTFPIITLLLILSVGLYTANDIMNGLLETYEIIIHMFALLILSLTLNLTITSKKEGYLEIYTRSILFRKKEYAKLKDIESVKRLDNKSLMKKSNFAVVYQEIETPVTSFDFNFFLSKEKIEDFLKRKD